VAYGFIRTRLTEITADSDTKVNIDGRDIKVGVNPDLMKAMEAQIPLGRGGSPRSRGRRISVLHSRIELRLRPDAGVRRRILAGLKVASMHEIAMLEKYRPTWMTEEHELLAATARRFTEQEVIPNDERWRKAAPRRQGNLEESRRVGTALHRYSGCLRRHGRRLRARRGDLS
jgi:hypothetical protein